ncbi:MAG: efflux RND transporter periplasmic adaptor subunit [Pseudomonadales bacterium]
MGNLDRIGHDNRKRAANVRLARWIVSGLGVLLANIVLAQNVEPSAMVETTSIIKKSVTQTISAYGAIEADPDALTVVALPRAGLVTRLHVRLGERVSMGDALLELDTAPGTRMQFSQAQAAQSYAEGQLQRIRQLFDEQLATRDQVANAERALSDATAQLRALKDVGADQKRQTVRAVTDGIVTGLSVSTGDRIAADTPALFLAQTTGLVVRLGVEPEDARRVPDDAALELVAIFQSDIRIPTQLEKVNAMINPSTRLVDAIAPIPEDAADQVTLGSIMRAEIRLASQDALVVPRSAVLYDQDGAYLYVVERNRARRVNVAVVNESAHEIGVKGQLNAGEVVVQTGNYVLSDGMTVRTSNAGS